MIYDNFDYDVHSCMELKGLWKGIQHIILLADVTEKQRVSMLRWAWANQIPLLGLLPRPMNINQLDDLMSLHHQVRGVALRPADRICVGLS
ncbi:hypothetical protein [Metapseudomonas otitidis]|uniref:hypothetical protein n=1 Tax=Metapseudomonas otitidis TaxID=319939 RepID=UPI0013F655CD|nr:hypothetical protein [Pseudomonas otitidis]